MSLIRFKQTIPLIFVTFPDGNTFQKDFHGGEFAEFDLQDNNGICWTLTAADGSYAPFVGRTVFEVLPEGFELYRFTQNVSLMFGIYDYVIDRWIYDIGSRPYLKGSVHAFRVFHGAPAPDNVMHLQTPDQQILPEIHTHRFIEKVNSSSLNNKKSRNKTPKQVLEAFPAPVPGVPGVCENVWSCPYSFNSLVVVRDGGVPSSILDCPSEPVAYLRLAEGDGRRYDKLYYRCSFFGVPRKLTAKV